ncbi:MAG: hypothetical protein M3014_01955 [Chloroflexota bacterium]|nr:hypothetical protein [Chloroflexota bacterium]
MRSLLQEKRRALLVASLLIALSLVATGLLGQQISGSKATANSAGQGSGSARAVEQGGLDVVEPGQNGAAEAQKLAARDAYWNTRYTYPTGKADRAWLVKAEQQARQVPNGVPNGLKTYTPPAQTKGNAPLITLDPNAFTSIGPQPQNSDTCQVCFSFGIVGGRVNDIVLDPITPTIAYIAVDGGGVWKTTSCCTAATTWTFTMADPLLSTIAIGTMTIDPNGHTIYAGTGDLTFGSFSFGSAGLLKSTDLGTTWQIKGADVFSPPYPGPPGAFFQYNSIGSVVVDPRNSNNLAVGTKTGLFLSYNGGDSWAGPCLPDPFPNQRQDITSMFAITNTGNLTDLFVAVGSRGYSTTVQINLSENGANGVYKSTFPTSGCPSNWSLISRGNNGWPGGTGQGLPQYVPGGNQVGRIDMTVAPSDHNYLYAEAQAINPGNGGLQRGGLLGVYRSTDRGVTWEQRVTAQKLEDNQSACGGDCVSDPLNVCGDYPQNWYDQRIAVDPTNRDYILFDNDDVWRSTDGGNTIEDITCGYASIQVPRTVHVDQHALAFLPAGAGTRPVLIGNDGGVNYTPNIDTTRGVYPDFLSLSTSLNTIEFYSGDISANFATSLNQFAVAGAQDNGSSSWPEDPNATTNLWGQRIGGDGFFARIEPLLGQRVYLEAQNGGLRLSETGHRGPYPLMNSSTNYSVDAPRLSFIFPYEIYKGIPAGTPGGGDECPGAPTGCLNMLSGTYRVWENYGGARSTTPWVPNSPDLTKNTLRDRSFINQLAYAPRTYKVAIAGTNDGNVAIGFNLGLAPAIAATWHDVTDNNAVLPNRPILDVALDPSVMMASTSVVGYAAVGGFNENTPSAPGHLFQVTCTLNCLSHTWTNKTGNLPNIPTDSVIANPNYPQQVFVGTDWGVYYTNNITANPPSWLHFANGIPNVMTWDFQIDRGWTTLAAFTRSRGAFVFPLPSAPFVLTSTPSPTGTPPSATPTTQAITRTPAIPPSYTAGPSNTPTSSATSQPSSTPLGCGATRLLLEGFESGNLGVFTATTAAGPPTEAWRASNALPFRGSYSAYVPDNDSTSDQQMMLSSPIAVSV